MNTEKNIITVKMKELVGEEWQFQIETYTTLRDFITSIEFLTVTNRNPNKLNFLVNGEFAEDDLLLVHGDIIEAIWAAGQKAHISPRDVVKKIRKMKGFELHRHGGKHDIWKTGEGSKVTFPRHARDLAPGTLRSILKQANIDMSLDEFVSKK
jgi:predicted RNA binding protein YcfA (HicA-like mRNA interferase family)